MEAGTSVLFILITTLALSYSWGMRGLVIGGEKGAMLPGAYLGFLLAWFSGSQVIRDNFWLFAAAGAVSMFFGGSEPYGQTADFVLHPERKNGSRFKGYVGVALKGALWFGISAAVIGMMFSAAAGVYKWQDIVLMVALIPVAQAIGPKIFNSPFNKEKGLTPAIYFSVDRREEWGGNLVTAMLIVTFMCLRGDDLGLILGCAGAASGAVGWAIALWLCKMSSKRLKNGRYLFGRLAENGYIDSWKIMEFTLGAIAGLTVSVVYALNFDFVKKRIDVIEQNGIFSPIAKLEPWISVAVCVIIMLSAVQYLAAYIKSGSSEGSAFRDEHSRDLAERPLYYLLPMAAVLLGSVNTAKFVAGFLIFWVAAEQTAFGGRLPGYRNKNLARLIIMLSAAAVLALQVLLNGFSPLVTWLLYGLPYLAFEFVWFFSPRTLRILKSKKGILAKAQYCKSLTTVYPFFALQILVLYAAAFYMF